MTKVPPKTVPPPVADLDPAHMEAEVRAEEESMESHAGGRASEASSGGGIASSSLTILPEFTGIDVSNAMVRTYEASSDAIEQWQASIPSPDRHPTPPDTNPRYLSPQ